MKILLDTHALFWFVEDSPNLSPRALEVIGSFRNEILISPASYWEMAIKISLGKWRLSVPYSDFLEIVFVQYGFNVLNITPEHTTQLIDLPYHHRDPFDRLLVSQSLAEKIPIVSADRTFDQYEVQRVW